MKTVWVVLITLLAVALIWFAYNKLIKKDVVVAVVPAIKKPVLMVKHNGVLVPVSSVIESPVTAQTASTERIIFKKKM